MSITFQVLDVNCENANAAFFVPQVQLSAVSTTKYAVVYGYNEFGSPSSPPKKYKTITFSGFSKRVGFTAEQTPRQCGGAKYVYSGAGQVDSKGKVITKWTKNFYAQCSKQFWPSEPLQTNPVAIPTTGNKFVGYCWPTDPNSCPTCDPVEANWPLLGNLYTGEPAVDLSGFMHNVNDPVVTPTSYTINDVFYGLTSINESGSWTFLASDPNGYNVVVGPNVYQGNAAITNPPSANLVFPVVVVNGVAGEYIVFTDTNNYSAVLTDEYTDAEALTNATVVVGTGTTAATLPRTTSFTSIFSAVAYTLKFQNLQSGKDYEATVDLWDQQPGTTFSVHTKKTYNFTASDVTFQLTDNVPTPASGHTITVRQPTVTLLI